jgi:hypothetical protein
VFPEKRSRAEVFLAPSYAAGVRSARHLVARAEIADFQIRRATTGDLKTRPGDSPSSAPRARPSLRSQPQGEAA